MQQLLQRNYIPLICAVVAVLRISASDAQIRAAEAVRPNIVFILADDLGYREVGAFGQQKIRTPHLDALAAQGMKLTQHYCGNAVCAPSRCVLMTGLHPGHTYVRDNSEMQPEGQKPIPDATVTLAERLKAQGYATGAFGKWGLGGPGSEGEPLRQGFDRFFGYNCQRHAHSYYPDYVSGFEDWTPTILDAIGAASEIPATADGVDLLPMLTGKPQAPRPFLYREFPGYGGQQTIRVGDWKAVRQGMARGNIDVELYNIASDIGEQHDVAAEHPEVVDQLTKLMAEQHQPSALFPLRPFDQPALNNRPKKQ